MDRPYSVTRYDTPGVTPYASTSSTIPPPRHQAHQAAAHNDLGDMKDEPLSDNGGCRAPSPVSTSLPSYRQPQRPQYQSPYRSLSFQDYQDRPGDPLDTQSPRIKEEARLEREHRKPGIGNLQLLLKRTDTLISMGEMKSRRVLDEGQSPGMTGQDLARRRQSFTPHRALPQRVGQAIPVAGHVVGGRSRSASDAQPIKVMLQWSDPIPDYVREVLEQLEEKLNKYEDEEDRNEELALVWGGSRPPNFRLIEMLQKRLSAFEEATRQSAKRLGADVVGGNVGQEVKVKTESVDDDVEDA